MSVHINEAGYHEETAGVYNFCIIRANSAFDAGYFTIHQQYIQNFVSSVCRVYNPAAANEDFHNIMLPQICLLHRSHPALSG